MADGNLEAISKIVFGEIYDIYPMNGKGGIK
jgi:hypothetical protein